MGSWSNVVSMHLAVVLLDGSTEPYLKPSCMYRYISGKRDESLGRVKSAEAECWKEANRCFLPLPSLINPPEAIFWAYGSFFNYLLLVQCKRHCYKLCCDVIWIVWNDTSCSQEACVYVCLVAQLYPTLCDSMDCSPPGSSVPGILQARILQWVAISFSRGLPDSGIALKSPAWQADSLPLSHLGSPQVFNTPC